MRGTAIGLLLASLSIGRGFAWAAPTDSLIARTEARRVAPSAIVSESSLEYYISLANRLVKGDTAKDIANLAARLDALKKEKQALQEKLRDAGGAIHGAQTAGDAKRAAALSVERDGLNGQLARVEVSIKQVLNEIQRLQEAEDQEQEGIKRAEEQLQNFLNELARTSSKQQTAIAGITSTWAFVSSLSANKKRDAEVKVRQALAQLAEARRMRLRRVNVSDPAFRAIPKPLSAK